ncbi:MAG: heparan-alpha-glucosaminide N-acetyltransferase, partial [Pseudomonadota bacterium]
MSDRPMRYPLIDIARGVALVAMTIYHFVWDLSFFGYVDPSVPVTGTMRTFARSIASSFLFLVGVSVVLAHGKHMHWAKFARRWVLVAGAAAIISIATWFATPQTFVYFGILHHIALGSLLALAFLRFPWWALIAAALVTYFVPSIFASDVFNSDILGWTGLNTIVRPSNDYVPLFPWFAAILVGMAFARSPAFASVPMMASAASSNVTKGLQWIGQRSLAYYMLHQPVLIGLLYIATLFAPPQPRMVADDLIPDDPFLDACETNCLGSAGADFCIAYCACTDIRLQQNGLKAPWLAGDLTVDDPAIADVTRQCTADIAGGLENPGSPLLRGRTN